MKQKKQGGSHPVGNRTVVGIICIAVALAICFGIAPLVNKLSDGKTEIVRLTKDVTAGTVITESDIEVVEVGSYNLPTSIITDKTEVIGKFALTNLTAGDYILPSKIGNDVETADSILGSLDPKHKAISITIGSYALGFSGKIETSDIVSILVYDEEEDKMFTPPELTYVKVITTTNANGVDKAEIEDDSQPVTVTLLVNAKQAEILAYYEQHGDMHIVLEYRGDAETAQKYLDIQNKVFGGDSVKNGSFFTQEVLSLSPVGGEFALQTAQNFLTLSEEVE